ncbi:DUF6262 family protein [Micromonospora sp. DT228]|uniref:DUF6262 family protein n=1 Tax=Micromonospora sp. DT228 TaxID=3393443 RepID=UPI003CF579E3
MTPTPRTAAANHARQASTRDKLRRVEQALKVIRRERSAVTYPAVARRAEVSRTFLYQNPQAHALVTAAVADSGDDRRSRRAEHDAHLEASWCQRALNAEEALKASYAEIGTQRERIAVLLGHIRDLQVEYTHDTSLRVAEENSTLKQQVRQLADATRGLEEKLRTARSNNRFLDKRIADLEAELVAAFANSV